MSAAGDIFLHLYGESRNADDVGFAFMSRYSTFMDASGKPEHGPEEWCVVAGFISTVRRWDDFEQTWEGFLAHYDIPHLQMSALHARKSPYAESRWNDPAFMAEFLSDAGSIIREHVLGWAADVVKNETFSRALSDRPGLGKYTNAYGLCGTAVALRLQMGWLEYHFNRSEKAQVEHFFEDGDKGIANIGRAFAQCGMVQPIVRPGKRQDGIYHRHYVQFQAADWLAFESRKLAKKCWPDKPVIRQSLAALLRNMPGSCKLWEYDDLIKFCDTKREKGQME